MAAAKVSNLDRVVDFFLNGDPAEIESAKATIKAIERAKANGAEPTKAKAPRQRRTKPADGNASTGVE